MDPATLVLLKLSAMILVWVEVAGDDDPVAELPPRERVLSLLTLAGRAKLYKDLPTPGNLHPGHRPRDLDGADLSVLGALLADVLQNVFILLLVSEFLRQDHVQ